MTFECNSISRDALELNFRNDYECLQNKNFFKVPEINLIKEYYFRKLLIQSITILPKLILPEAPYPKDTKKHMDVYLSENNAVEIKYFHARKKPLIFRNKSIKGFYIDLLRLILPCPKEWSRYYFETLNEIMFQDFRERNLITQKDKFVNRISIESVQQTKKNKYDLEVKLLWLKGWLIVGRKIRKEVGVPFTTPFTDLDLKIRECIPHFEVNGYHFFFLKIEPISK